MRYFLIIFLFFGCSQKNPPHWYNQASIKTDTVSGYADALTCKEAKILAREDIALQLHVDIDTILNMQSTQNTKEIKTRTFESSQLGLSDIRLKKSEMIGGRCYVQMQYSVKPLFIKVAIEAKKSKVKHMSNKNILYYTYFSKILKNSIGYVPYYQLSFNDKNIMLHIAQSSYYVAQSELKQFLFKKSSDVVTMKIELKSHLYIGDYYKISLFSKKSGYISILYIDEYFRTQVLVNNQYIYANNKMLFPKKDRSIEANISSHTDKIQEMYITFFCKDIVDLSAFEILDATLHVDKNSLTFSQLVPIMKDCEVTSKIISINNTTNDYVR